MRRKTTSTARGGMVFKDVIGRATRLLPDGDLKEGSGRGRQRARALQPGFEMQMLNAVNSNLHSGASAQSLCFVFFQTLLCTIGAVSAQWLVENVKNY